MDFHELTCSAAARAIRDGEITSEAYLRALVDRAESHRRLNCFLTLDAVGALQAAKAADDERRSGRPLGPLHGVPLVLKDNIDTAGLATTAGTPALAGHRPAANGAVAQSLLDAGAIVLGKTNLHELAYGVTNNNGAHGPARNPYDPDKIPGGSSGGTGVAVAARLAPGGLGTDTGGSVRIPAALCGIVGFRPSTQRYSQAGIVPISNTRDTAGPMTRSVADAVLIDGVVTGGPTSLEPTPLGGLRLAVPRRPFYDDLDPEVAEAAEAELRRLADLGVVLVEADIAEVSDLVAAAGFPIAFYETVATLGDYLAASGTGLSLGDVFQAVASPDVKGMAEGLLGELAVAEPVYRAALEVHRPALQALVADYFRSHDVAAMIFPTTPLPARPIGDDETVELNGRQVPTFLTYIRNTDPASNAGIPGLSLPIATTGAGLPIGMELDAPAGHDHRLLSIGLAYQASLPALPAPPEP